jgi:NAD(P)H-dependent flavin oxidoreductase YrpB (nitropropane dioxygenase family)
VANRVCELFQIRYPVILGAVDFSPEFSAVVANAGGLGCLKAYAGSQQLLRDRIRRFRELSDRPFAVNFLLTMASEEETEAKMTLLMDEQVPVMINVRREPDEMDQAAQSERMQGRPRSLHDSPRSQSRRSRRRCPHRRACGVGRLPGTP